MLWYAPPRVLVIVPLALIFFQPSARSDSPLPRPRKASGKARVLGWPPNFVFALMCGASVLCCIPMAMPQGHLVASAAISASPHGRRVDAVGAAGHGVSVAADLGRDLRPHRRARDRADRIGLAGGGHDLVPADARTVGLFTVAAAFGLGFSGIIPAYVLALRELFPASEASWRIPTLLLFSGLAWPPAAGLPGSVRSFRLLRAGLRRRHRLEHAQSGGGRAVGGAPALPRGLRLRFSRTDHLTPPIMAMAIRPDRARSSFRTRPAPRSPPRRWTRRLPRKSRCAMKSAGGGTGCAWPACGSKFERGGGRRRSQAPRPAISAATAEVERQHRIQSARTPMRSCR